MFSDVVTHGHQLMNVDPRPSRFIETPRHAARFMGGPYDLYDRRLMSWQPRSDPLTTKGPSCESPTKRVLISTLLFSMCQQIHPC